jgi:hypothetical protein
MIKRIDERLAFQCAVNSCESLLRAILEIVFNACDYGNEVVVFLTGEIENGKFVLKSFRVEDNGCGMSHDTVMQKFFGAYWDSDSHDNANQSGLMGVGTATPLKYFKEILVKTTTSGFIPEEWECHPDSLDEISRTFSDKSTLKNGELDTEWRNYAINLSKINFVGVETVADNDSGTVVTVSSPNRKLYIDVEEVIQMLSRRISWLKGNNKMKLVVEDGTPGRPKQYIIKPFDEYDSFPVTSVIAQVNGKSDKPILVQCMKDSVKPIEVPGPKIFNDIKFDVRVIGSGDSDHRKEKMFVMDVCGSNVYDDNKGNAALSKIGVLKLTGGVGFMTRIHGYVSTNNLKLKTALRHNRTILDMDDENVKVFIAYVQKVFKSLHAQYMKANEHISDDEDEIVRSGVEEMLDLTFRENGKRRQKKNKGGKVSAHKAWQCNSCGKNWKTLKSFRPTYCAEGHIDGDEGCKSGDVGPKHNRTTGSAIKVSWCATLGDWLPASYSPDDNVVVLSRSHPDFIPNGGAKKSRDERIIKGAEKALFAVAVYRAKENGEDIDTAYPELLRDRYRASRNSKHKRACEKYWEANSARP